MTQKIKLMTINQRLNTLNEWLDSPDHTFNCTAHNEGQYCCLDVVPLSTSNGHKGRLKLTEIFTEDRKCIKQTLLETIENLLNTAAQTHADQSGYICALEDTKNAINKIL